MPVWAISLVGVGVIVGVLAVVAFARLEDEAVRSRPRPDADPWFALGISLAGAGSALFATVGIGMIGIFVAGLAFIVVGARRMRPR